MQIQTHIKNDLLYCLLKVIITINYFKCCFMQSSSVLSSWRSPLRILVVITFHEMKTTIDFSIPMITVSVPRTSIRWLDANAVGSRFSWLYFFKDFYWQSTTTVRWRGKPQCTDAVVDRRLVRCPWPTRRPGVNVPTPPTPPTPPL